MCGIFGYFTKDAKPVDLAVLRKVAIKTQERGRHAFGFSWLDADGKIQSYKQAGSIGDGISKLGMVEGSYAMIGHCRFATHGDPSDNANNHPHECRNGWLVHNGVVRNYLNLCDDYNLTMKSECDSEVIALLVAQPGKVLQRTIDAVKRISGPLAVLGLWPGADGGGEMVIARNGNPVHFSEDDSGFWFGSFPDHLPGKVNALADGNVCRMKSAADWKSLEVINKMAVKHIPATTDRLF